MRMMSRIPPSRQRDMAKPNPLQEQLLKAGLVKKSKVAAVAREQNKAKHAKTPPTPNEVKLEAERARVEKVERDRALAAGQRAQARIAELRAQARQIIEDKKVPRMGEIEYRFAAHGAIHSLQVNEALRRQLASGALVIARLGERYEVLPRAAGDKVRERDAGMIVLDHGAEPAAASNAASEEDDDYYAQFKVPDDLVW